MRSFVACGLLAVLSWSSASAQAPAAALAALLNDKYLDGARIGVVVEDLADGAVLCTHDAGKGFMTASNMKLVTAATALVSLGPEFRFTTLLEARGETTDGVLHGDLVLIGSGDPTLGAQRPELDGAPTPFDAFVRALRERGLRKIDGRVIGDDDCQPDEGMGEGWAWGYEGESYAAPVSGLCFAENCAWAELTFAQPGRAPAMRIVPTTAYLTVDCGVRCVADGRTADVSIERAPRENRVRLTGTLPERAKTARVSFSVHDPAKYAATVLLETLTHNGIEVTGGAFDIDDVAPLPSVRREVVAQHASPPLRQILRTLGKVSQNLYAEQLVRQASRAATGKAGMADAARHCKRVLGDLGVDVEGMVVADGSGLTRLDLVRPAQLAALLRAMWSSPHRDDFLGILPVAGVDGTLSTRFQNSVAKGRVHAKTGYISRVVALSGYVVRSDQKAPPLVFSVMLNNFTCSTDEAKAAVDTFVEALARHAGWTE